MSVLRDVNIRLSLGWILSVRGDSEAWEGEIFTEFGFNLSPEAKVSLARSKEGTRDRLDIVLDADGTTWDVLQVGHVSSAPSLPLMPL